MKRFFAALFICLAGNASAWDAVGHMITAQIASDFLTPAARAHVDQILADYNARHGTEYSIVTMTCWMDDIRNRTKAYNTWHYIELPYAMEYPRDNSPDNVLWAARLSRKILMGKTSHPELGKAEALFMLAHLIGDMHQPLHTIGRGDAGGNRLLVTNMEDPSAPDVPRLRNLHFFWDGAYRRAFKKGHVGVAYKTPFYSYDNPMAGHLAALPVVRNQAVRLLEKYPPGTLDLGGGLSDWVQESHTLGYTLAYGQLPGRKRAPSVALTKSYVDQARECAEVRLVEAGYRIAMVLNGLFDRH